MIGIRIIHCVRINSDMAHFYMKKLRFVLKCKSKNVERVPLRNHKHLVPPHKIKHNKRFLHYRLCNDLHHSANRTLETYHTNLSQVHMLGCLSVRLNQNVLKNANQNCRIIVEMYRATQTISFSCAHFKVIWWNVAATWYSRNACENSKQA